jgi:hypothetical protein
MVVITIIFIRLYPQTTSDNLLSQRVGISKQCFVRHSRFNFQADETSEHSLLLFNFIYLTNFIIQHRKIRFFFTVVFSGTRQMSDVKKPPSKVSSKKEV